jgi:MFS transporter, PAT family, beta-lactamase induction signal transducer AmpG
VISTRTVFREYVEALGNRRILVTLLLGFASGLPLALTSGTLQAWMTVEGVNLKTIGIFTLVGLPYTWKFLWSPLMDRFVPPLLGRRRGWILLTQLALMAGIAIMGATDPKAAPWALAALAVFVAFSSASQDIVYDAYSTDVLRPNERGMGAAMKVMGYRIAMLVSGAFALIIAAGGNLFGWFTIQGIGWQQTYWLMAGLMMIGVAAVLYAPELEEKISPPRTLTEAVLEPLREFFSRRSAWLLLALIVLYKFGDAFAVSLSTTFLIRGAGFSPAEVGAVNKGMGLFATILGVLFGGALMVRLGLFWSLLVFGFLQAVSNLLYAWVAIAGHNYKVMTIAIASDNICGGMGTTAFVALLMALCNRRFTATQFALLSALASIGRVYVGPLAGYLTDPTGAGLSWPTFFVITFLSALPGVAMVWWMRSTIDALSASSDAPKEKSGLD